MSGLGRDYDDDGNLLHDPMDPLAGIRLAAATIGDDRPGAIYRAITRMVDAGAEDADLVSAREYVLDKKLLKAKAFDRAVATAQASAGNADDQAAANQATALVDLARKSYRFYRTAEQEIYAVLEDGPNIAVDVGRNGPFAWHLIRLMYEMEGTIPSDQAERQAVKLLHAYAHDQDPEPVYLRVAPWEGQVILDLGTRDGACIIIGPSGWSTESRSPVPFRRGAGLPLPRPVRSANGLVHLRGLVNATDDQFRFAVAWLVAAIIPAAGIPIIFPRGEQGSAKTTFCRILQQVIDPSGLDPGAFPKDDRDLAVRMNAGYVQAFDNVSAIPGWLSDALCRATTGTSFTTRTLYTDTGLTILRYRRPIILNGIEAGNLNGDLIERSLPMDLQRITSERRRPERAALGDDPKAKPGVFDTLDRHHPEILGAVLSLASDVLRNAPLVSPRELPRMADFGKALAALDKCQKWNTLRGYTEIVENETGQSLEGEPFAVSLVDFMQMLPGEEWTGTATALWNQLTSMLPESQRPPNRLPPGWPKDAPRAGGILSRRAPALRVHGVIAEQDREGHARIRSWSIRKVPSAPSALSAQRVSAGSGVAPADSADSNADSTADADSMRTVSREVTVRSVSAGQTSLFGSADSADSNFRQNYNADSTHTSIGTPNRVRQPSDDIDPGPVITDSDDVPLPPEPPDDPYDGRDDWPAESIGAEMNPPRSARQQPRRNLTRAQRHDKKGKK